MHFIGLILSSVFCVSHKSKANIFPGLKAPQNQLPYNLSDLMAHWPLFIIIIIIIIIIIT
jgi:hypothetical protein